MTTGCELLSPVSSFDTPLGMNDGSHRRDLALMLVEARRTGLRMRIVPLDVPLGRL